MYILIFLLVVLVIMGIIGDKLDPPNDYMKSRKYDREE